MMSSIKMLSNLTLCGFILAACHSSEGSSQETLQVSIANMTAMIDPGGEHLFNVPFGQYLASGVHLIEVKPCCGASL